MTGKAKYDVAEHIGNRYGQWTVLGFAEARRYGIYWNCECTCGDVYSIMAVRLMTGKTRACISCSRFPDDTSVQIFSRAYLARVKRDAAKRGFEWAVDIEYLSRKWEQQHHQCALTGVLLEPGSNKAHKSGRTASLDRIDSSEGYIEGNVQWVHKDINRMKNAFDQEYFIHMCRLVAGACEV